MSIQFERKVESGDDLPPGHVRITTAVAPQPALPVTHRIEQLEDEVDHLRACIDQLLDLLDAQLDTNDYVELLSDRMSLFERRMQRAEDGVTGLYQAEDRRAGDA